MSEDTKPDWFARGMAIIGLIIAIAAIIVPYYKDKADSQEALSIAAAPESGGGILRLSDNLEKSRAIQMPWIVTLSNTGKVRLSITSYSIQKLEGDGVSYFPGLDGGATDSTNRPFPFPKNLDAGESIAFRLHIGFLPTKEVGEVLRNMLNEHGPVDYHSGFIALAMKGLTFYGGSASYQELPNNGGTMVKIDSSSYKNDPIYKISFSTGRGNKFPIFTSESAAKWHLTMP
ncbi:MAG: hypothetical protein H7829_01340 [Magnetococcus sp. THC-1_WYH]